MAKPKKEPGKLSVYRTQVTVKVMGKLYASSPTNAEGIDAMLRANQPTDAQIDYRQALGEPLKSVEELCEEVTAQTLPPAEEIARTLEGGKSPSTVFRRDREGNAFLHSNYFKGHLRDCGETASRIMGIWGLHDLVTRTVIICPERLYLDTEIKYLRTFFTPEVRTAQGIRVKMPTEKIAEYVEDPELTWMLYIGADLRWNEEVLESILAWGSMRGLGPGRCIDQSKYIFTMKPWQKLNHLEAMKTYIDDFKTRGKAVFPVLTASRR